MRYNETQGAEFAFLRAVLVGVVNAADFGEFQYAFESNIISDELLNGLAGGEISGNAVIGAAGAFIKGLLNKKIRLSTVKAAAAAVRNGIALSGLYTAFPKTPEGFGEWCKAVNEIYDRIGKIK